MDSEERSVAQRPVIKRCRLYTRNAAAPYTWSRLMRVLAMGRSQYMCHMNRAVQQRRVFLTYLLQGDGISATTENRKSTSQTAVKTASDKAAQWRRIDQRINLATCSCSNRSCCRHPTCWRKSHVVRHLVDSVKQVLPVAAVGHTHTAAQRAWPSASCRHPSWNIHEV